MHKKEAVAIRSHGTKDLLHRRSHPRVHHRDDRPRRRRAAEALRAEETEGGAPVSRHTHDQLVSFVESIWKLHPPPDINLAVVATIIDDEKGGGSISTEARASEVTVEA